MTKPAVKKSSVGLVTTTPTQPYIDKRKLGRIIDRLYVAIAHSYGLYKTVKMETHAPQQIYYPGSPAVQPKLRLVSSQASFITVDDDAANDIEQAIEIEHVIRVLVERGTPEHICWLWFATLTDRREDSMKVYKAHCQIHADHPEFYTKEVLSIDPRAFRKALDSRKYKIGSPGQSVGYWLICARTLFEEFDGDPIKLLKHAGWSVESVYAWKQAQKKPVEKGGRGYDPIPGWGRKLLSLFFLYLSELGHPLPPDAFASDVHAQAITIQIGALKYVDKESIGSMKLAEMLRVLITNYCKKKGYDVVLLAHASWLLGSNLCDQCSKRVDAKVLCPIYEDCGGRVDTSYYWKKGEWPKKLPRMNKGGERPPFGVPTDVVPRLRQRGTTQVIPIAQIGRAHV